MNRVRQVLQRALPVPPEEYPPSICAAFMRMANSNLKHFDSMRSADPVQESADLMVSSWEALMGPLEKDR